MRLFPAACCAALLLCIPASAQHIREQDRARQETKAGRVMPLHEIEGRILPKMKGADYLGPEFDGTGVYRLKFMRGNAVIWVDVDGRTGNIVGRSGY